MFAISETGPEAAAGDYFTALELGTAIQARTGWKIDYRPKGDDWLDLTGIDILVVMRDDYQLDLISNAKSNLIKVAWARNWFERWCDIPNIEGFDLIFASSQCAARFMSQRAGRLVKIMRIASNAERFNTHDRHQPPVLDYVFTGSYWQAERDIVDSLASLPKSFNGAVYGKHWDQVPSMVHLNRGFVPYDQLPAIYSQAAIVIDDANHVTKDWGAANSRVFDALAAGCLVITNSQSVSDEVFGGLLPVYQNAKDLADKLTFYLGDVDARLKLQEDLRTAVLTQHLYTHRAFEFGLHLRHVKQSLSD